MGLILDCSRMSTGRGEEFAPTLNNLAEGKIKPEPLAAAKVGVEGVAQAFKDLASPEMHAKVEPRRS